MKELNQGKNMVDNKDSYTVKEYSRNKNIFRWIKIVIILIYFIVLTYFVYGIFTNSKSPYGLAFISIIVFFLLKILDSFKKDKKF